MADDYTPSCWIVGDEDGGHAAWEKSDADAARENGWAVLPMYSDAVLDKAIRQAKAEALREAAHVAWTQRQYPISQWLNTRADRIGGDQG